MSHRTLALAVSTSLATAALVALAPTVSAAPSTSSGSFDVDTSAAGPNACEDHTTLSGTESVQVAPNGVPRQVGQLRTGTVHDPADPGPRTSVTNRAGGTATIRSQGGRLVSADIALRTALKMAKPAPTSCNAYSMQSVELGFTFTIDEPGWFTADIDNRRAGELATGLDTPGTQDWYHETDHPYDSASLRTYLVAGTYFFHTEVRRGHSVETGNLDTAGTASVRVGFTEAGAATSAAVGGGRTFVALPDARDCAGNAVAAAFKQSARKVRKATFYVNGAKKKTVRTPKKGQTVRLTGLADAKAATVRSVVVLKPARKGKPSKVKTVTRSYAACSA
ncbi:hypothetical protein [Nocardioides sp. SYSU D00038]|uniref:hypothetical protein n=1 Tax=Nocardioides sp. SYSU D00038 TaxID=2812554 RepID=UPI001967FAFE|nr:hypothetical protein [Nocardioides sp. SYSU D00038]